MDAGGEHTVEQPGANAAASRATLPRLKARRAAMLRARPDLRILFGSSALTAWPGVAAAAGAEDGAAILW
jgi:hypothetical protein